MKAKIIYGFIILLFSFFFYLVETANQSYIQRETAYLKNQLKSYSDQLKLHFQFRIKSIADTISVVKTNNRSQIINKSKSFTELVENQVNHQFYLYAVNYINPDGVIEWVYPEDKNQAALNKKIIKKESVREYLLKSKISKTAHMSAVVETYQGVKGIAIYDPIYSNDVFHGWTNILFEYEKLITIFLKEADLEQIQVQVIWKNAFEDQFSSDRFDTNSKKSISYQDSFKIMNQKIKIIIETSRRPDSIFYNSIIWFLRISIFTLMIVAIFLIKQLKKIQKQYNKLEMGRILVNTLSHDLASPITSLEIFGEQMKDQLSPKQKERFHYAINRFKNILYKGREIQKSELHKPVISLEELSLLEEIKEVLHYYKEKIKEKNLDVQIEVPDIKILSNQEILRHNLLSNIIDNAIKFSPEMSKIEIWSLEKADLIELHIRDYGLGIPKEKLSKLRKNKKLFNEAGLHGESSSGLGWIQIFYFSNKTQADVEIESETDGKSEKRGTTVTLKLKKANSTKD